MLGVHSGSATVALIRMAVPGDSGVAGGVPMVALPLLTTMAPVLEANPMLVFATYVVTTAPPLLLM